MYGDSETRTNKEIIHLCKQNHIDILCIQETNFRAPKDVTNFKNRFGLDAFSLTDVRSCGTGIIFISTKYRESAHYTCDTEGRITAVDVFVDEKRLRIINVYAPVTRSLTNKFFKKLRTYLLEPRQYIILGD